MARPITGDHVLYDECIEAFRIGSNNPNVYVEGERTSLIVTPFNIVWPWDLGICTINPSTTVKLAGGYHAFVSEVNNPKWVGKDNPHLFGIALSALVSFVTLKTCKSPRDYIIARDEAYSIAALSNPIFTAGPGGVIPLSIKNQLSAYNELKPLITLLHEIEYDKYQLVMQGIRLIHLSLINKKEDFGLGYLLIVSAIETIAQHVIKRDKVKEINPLVERWAEKVKSDKDFSDLFSAYKSAIGNNQYLKERYVQFILKYAPVSLWEQYVPHPFQETYDQIKEQSPDVKFDSMISKSKFEKYPNDLTDSEIKKILSDTYNYRSSFVHRGEQPKKISPNHQNRFFQEHNIIRYDQRRIEEKILANYELLLSISKYSILNWLNEKF